MCSLAGRGEVFDASIFVHLLIVIKDFDAAVPNSVADRGKGYCSTCGCTGQLKLVRFVGAS